MYQTTLKCNSLVLKGYIRWLINLHQVQAECPRNVWYVTNHRRKLQNLACSLEVGFLHVVQVWLSGQVSKGIRRWARVRSDVMVLDLEELSCFVAQKGERPSAGFVLGRNVDDHIDCGEVIEPRIWENTSFWRINCIRIVGTCCLQSSKAIENPMQKMWGKGSSGIHTVRTGGTRRPPFILVSAEYQLSERLWCDLNFWFARTIFNSKSLGNSHGVTQGCQAVSDHLIFAVPTVMGAIPIAMRLKRCFNYFKRVKDSY